MPVFNAEKWLNEAIHSVVIQTYPYWELIAINDGSTDGTLKQIKSWETEENRIKVFDKENEGPAKARALGLKYAKGDYIFYLDSDDTISKNMLKACLTSILNTNADVAMPNLIQRNANMFVKDNFESNGIKAGMVISGDEAFYHSIDWQGVWSYMMCETNLYRRYACDEKYLYGSFNSDELITRMVLLNCNKVVYCSAEYYYNINSEGITKKISPKVFGYLETHLRLIQEAKKNNLPRNVEAKIETTAFREMIELWHQYLDNTKHFSKENRKEIFDKFDSFHKHFPKENINEMLSIRPGITPKLQRLLLLHGWPLCRLSLTLARIVGKRNKLYPWFPEEQIKELK